MFPENPQLCCFSFLAPWLLVLTCWNMLCTTCLVLFRLAGNFVAHTGEISGNVINIARDTTDPEIDRTPDILWSHKNQQLKENHFKKIIFSRLSVPSETISYPISFSFHCKDWVVTFHEPLFFLLDSLCARSAVCKAGWGDKRPLNNPKRGVTPTTHIDFFTTHIIWICDTHIGLRGESPQVTPI